MTERQQSHRISFTDRKMLRVQKQVSGYSNQTTSFTDRKMLRVQKLDKFAALEEFKFY